MGLAMEILAGFATAPGTSLTAVTMSAGLSTSVRNFAESDSAALIAMWTDSQGIGQFQIRSPQFHDNVQGINIATQISEAQPLSPWGMKQNLKPQDTPIVAISGSNTAGDIETGCWINFYNNLPGIAARLMNWADIKDKIESFMISTNTLSTGTAGGFSGQEAINAEVDNWKANRDYALLGYQCTIECAAVRWQGSDTGNLGVGGPGHELFKSLTGDWFVRLNEATGLPTIPVFNAANKSSILIDCAQDENGADPLVTSIFALLAQ